MPEDRTIERITLIEERLTRKFERDEFWKIMGPFVLAGAVVVTALGYVDLRMIPQTFALRVSDEVDKARPKILELVRGAAVSSVEDELVSLLGRDYKLVLSKLAGVSMGVAHFQHKERPSGDQWQDLDRVEVRFSRKYEVTPQIFISVNKMEAYFRHPSPTFGFRVENPSPEGFHVPLSGAYLRSLSGASVNWMAIEPALRR